ncbi:FUSC family protein [Novosphingopyxis iocasae]|uniref:FUSC family protein n=1 Tax=Novosphingopyxis iocasae TaxID=2762729 RepID=UPI001651918C|nr:FUSC family protein [Novosphingopyxis iocasae]
MAAPLSPAGVWQALRWPTKSDAIFSAKALIATTLALFIGFSQNLANPYWSALTVYIVMLQPQSGAIRTKAIYRVVGTVLGGAAVLAAVALFADHEAMLVFVAILIVLASVYGRMIDRTPRAYTWFTIGLTAGFIAFNNLMQPNQIFDLTAARVAEITLAVLAVAAVDSVISPTRIMPQFESDMEDWRQKARGWVTDILNRVDGGSDPGQERVHVRERLRGLVGAVQNLDQLAIQLPYDIVDRPPRRRDVNILRRTIMYLISDMASLEDWTVELREGGGPDPALAVTIGAVARWLNEEDERTQADCLTMIDRTAERFAQRTDWNGLVQIGYCDRLAQFVRHWGDFRKLIAVIRQDEALPRHLLEDAKAARPVRAYDYLLTLRDIAPMALALFGVAGLWYWTAFASGGGALLFAFLSCVFILGKPQQMRSVIGLVMWFSCAFALVFAYNFAVLPTVSSFVPLMAVLALALFPLGMVYSMTIAGLLICVLGFAFLGLQNAYSADFERSLLSLGAAGAGVSFAAASLHLLSYNRSRFLARRQVRAIWTDIADLATARRVPDRNRFLLLTIDRLALALPEIDMLEDGEPLKHVDAIDDLRVGLNLLTLRNQDQAFAPDFADRFGRLRQSIAEEFRQLRIGDRLAREPLELSRQLVRDVVHSHGTKEPERLRALVGLTIALAPSVTPFAEEGAGGA